MSVQFPGRALPHLDALLGVQRDLRSAFGRLASGRRIQSAADDASGLAVVERLRALEASIHRGIHNLGDGDSLARTAEGGLAEISDALGRMRELSVRARNGTLTESDRDLIQLEYDQLAAEVTRAASSTRFNGHGLLNGDISGNGALRITDHTGFDVELSLSDHSAQALGVDGLAVGDPETLDALDGAIRTVAASRADVGAVQNRIDARVQDHRQHSANVADARSRIADADVAAETALLVRSRILESAQLALGVHHRRESTSVLDLLL